MRVKLVEPLSYVVVISWDNCDPEVYGLFKSEEDAKAEEDYIKGKWTSQEWNHNPCTSIEKLLEVKK
jgi:hypothetical protein